MAQFDRDIDRYEKASGENFPNNIRILSSTVLGRPVGKHLRPRSTMSDERRLLASSTSQPVDPSAYGARELDAFQKSKSHGKGEDKGKPKEDLPKTSRFTTLATSVARVPPDSNVSDQVSRGSFLEVEKRGVVWVDHALPLWTMSGDAWQAELDRREQTPESQP